MSEAWRVASITYFEQVPIGTVDALLRVAAISTIDARLDDPRPTLVADDGVAVTHFAALPAPPDEGPDLRCGYSVGVDLDLFDTVFSLELEDGNVIALPSPTLTAPIGGPSEPEMGEEVGILDEEPGFGPEPAPDAGPSLGLLLDAAQARAELAAMRELQTLRPTVARRPPLDAGDADGRLAELQLWSGELERRLADASTELDAAQRAASQDAAELERLRAELAAARAGNGGAPAPDELSGLAADALAAAGARAARDLADAAS